MHRRQSCERRSARRKNSKKEKRKRKKKQKMLKTMVHDVCVMRLERIKLVTLKNSNDKEKINYEDEMQE